MRAAFDTYAPNYDQEFTYSAIGNFQRAKVWDLLGKDGIRTKKLKILEVNCGTGEDALWLSSLGHEVVATDVSENMIAVAQQKAEKVKDSNLRFITAGFSQISLIQSFGPFDLVFSDFGGLNCIGPDDFKKFMNKAHALLAPGGSFIAVIMPRFCWWETVFYLLKNPALAFRRMGTKAVAKLEDSQFDVYYYSPKFVSKTLGFHLVKISPVGFFLPPSYLE
ncbi:MAG: class I SAM-dependent methyltransferase, partial [Cytophagales bacterium]|nr:class I SAM-dependent methyltransferase [Cytophagales bacterium]